MKTVSDTALLIEPIGNGNIEELAALYFRRGPFLKFRNIPGTIYQYLSRLTLLENKKSGGTEISTFFYEYDKAGNRTKRADDATSPAAELKYTYDNIYEIAEVYQNLPTPAQALETFAYDGAGTNAMEEDNALDRS